MRRFDSDGLLWAYNEGQKQPVVDVQGTQLAKHALVVTAGRLARVTGLAPDGQIEVTYKHNQRRGYRYSLQLAIITRAHDFTLRALLRAVLRGGDESLTGLLRDVLLPCLRKMYGRAQAANPALAPAQVWAGVHTRLCTRPWLQKAAGTSTDSTVDAMDYVLGEFVVSGISGDLHPSRNLSTGYNGRTAIRAVYAELYWAGYRECYACGNFHAPGTMTPVYEGRNSQSLQGDYCTHCLTLRINDGRFERRAGGRVSVAPPRLGIHSHNSRAAHFYPAITPTSWSGRHCGIEIEGGFETQRLWQGAAQALANESLAIVKHDGSICHVNYEGEIVTPPMATDHATYRRVLARVGSILESHGFLANTSCGIHVHVSADSLSALQQGRLLCMFMGTEDSVVWSNVFGRAQTNYCQRVPTRYDCDVTLRAMRKSPAVARKYMPTLTGRYAALSCNTHHGTHEFRMFGYCTRTSGFIARLEVALSLCGWARSMPTAWTFAGYASWLGADTLANTLAERGLAVQSMADFYRALRLLSARQLDRQYGYACVRVAVAMLRARLDSTVRRSRLMLATANAEPQGLVPTLAPATLNLALAPVYGEDEEDEESDEY